MASTPSTTTATLLPADAEPPKSKSQPYYSVHPSWQDVVPIPQVDQTGALAAIAYSPRYAEAMSYLRAVMADNEVSGRALALTKDLIGMNPAHYTVWIYRMRVLRGLWKNTKSVEGAAEGSEVETEIDGNQVDEVLWLNIQEELRWLDEVSFRNLKNYQIWHHRHALVDLLPYDSPAVAFTASPSSSSTSTTADNYKADTKITPLSTSTRSKLSNFITSEQTFLAQILSLDTKNYHVWSYRQYICTRFPTFLLPSYTILSSLSPSPSDQPQPQSQPQSQPPQQSQSISQTYKTHPELLATTILITTDIHNNSAWSHRYFILFGHHELSHSYSSPIQNQRHKYPPSLVDNPLTASEISYTQSQIRLAPSNSSSWNYLRGILTHSSLSLSTTRQFCEEFIGPENDVWMDQFIDVEIEIQDPDTGEVTKSTERQEIGVRSSHAVEWLSEIYASEGTDEGRKKARECLRALGEKWDVIRRGYWEYLAERIENEQSDQSQEDKVK